MLLIRRLLTALGCGD